MIGRIKNAFAQLVDKYTFQKMRNELTQTRINNGKLLGNLNLIYKRDEILKDIKKSEFQVFSQWGDDGIINFLINYLDIDNKRFVEFGVENYTECNTRFLLINDNWTGLIMDGSEKHMNAVRSEDLYWRHDLTALDTFVTAENINALVKDNGFGGEIGLFHIDIDGNDYWIWNALQKDINPIIMIVEYNSIFGFDKPWTVQYDPSFVRSNAHYSNLLYGTSLLSICDLAETKGYSFIGCNANGNNAYFVRKDKMKGLEAKTPEQGYVQSKFSESRNQDGQLTFLKGEARLKSLKGQTVFNTRTGQTESI